MNEVEQIKQRYAKRASMGARYSMLCPSVYMAMQERERALVRLLSRQFGHNVADKSVLEVGCGGGGNLLQLIRLGFTPNKLVGNELLDERVQIARKCLPNAVRIIPGDACQLDLPKESFDIVYQSVVFSSILDDVFQEKLAAQMWDMAKIGGGILWYDFIYNNPANSDVRGVPLRRVKELFPQGKIKY